MSDFYDKVRKMRDVARPIKPTEVETAKPKKKTEKKPVKRAVKKNDEGTSTEA